MTAMPGFLQTVSLPNCFMLFVICDFLSARTKLMSFRARLMSFQALPFSVISSAAYVISSAARNPDVRLQNEFQTRFTSFGIKISPHCVRRNDMPGTCFKMTCRGALPFCPFFRSRKICTAEYIFYLIDLSAYIFYLLFI